MKSKESGKKFNENFNAFFIIHYVILWPLRNSIYINSLMRIRCSYAEYIASDFGKLNAAVSLL